MKKKISIMLIILTLNISCNKKKFRNNVKLSYQLENQKCYDKLIVKIDGKEETLVDYSEKLKLRIILIDDFNNDGNLDVLLESIKGCENMQNGYSIKSQGNSYFIFTSNGQEFFRTKEIGNDWDGVKIEIIDGVLNFTVENSQKRYYKTQDEIPETDTEEVYVLDNYSIEQKSVQIKKNIIQKEENNRYKVFAKNGLIIRDEPNGDPIGKLDFGEEIDIDKKTNIKFRFEDNGTTIDGYWYQVTKNNQKGYVFSGYLVNTDYCSSIFTDWYILNIYPEGILFKMHGQCYISFPIKILSKNEIEVIWSPSVDCKFSPGIWDYYNVDKSPQIGKPFAKYIFRNNKLEAIYYYPKWVNKYIYSDMIFMKSYYINYHYLNGN